MLKIGTVQVFKELKFSSNFLYGTGLMLQNEGTAAILEVIWRKKISVKYFPVLLVHFEIGI
jgi:hypothetical protein